MGLEALAPSGQWSIPCKPSYRQTVRQEILPHRGSRSTSLISTALLLHFTRDRNLASMLLSSGQSRCHFRSIYVL